jgi:hypothetical protein
MGLRFWLLLLLTTISCTTLYGQTSASTDSLLNHLNEILARKETFVKQKLDRIESLNNKLQRAGDLKTRYAVYKQLFDEYKTFSYDSAYSYSKKMLIAAKQLNDPLKIAGANMDLGFTLISSGMFKETIETLNKIDTQVFPDSSKIDYYYLKARSYFDLSDFDRTIDYSAIYTPLGLKCLDSALKFCKPGSYYYLTLVGLKDLRTNNYNEGISDYTQLLNLPNLTDHQYAVNACSLSYLYEVHGEQDKAIALLIKAAIADIKSATKETVAIYQLANYLYKQGDQKNAFVYINQAMDEATFYGARHRQVTISSILPIIEAQRIATVEQQRRSLFIYASLITLLVIFVIGFAVIIFIQLKKIRIADKIIHAANISLQESNENLEETNKKLSIANRIKNDYIGYYFNINSVYIDKLENFKKSLDKKLASKRYEDAMLAVHNLNLDSERQELYHTFDKVFLNLFPDFITRFNALFKPEDQMIIPNNELLNTELRIFALIRMGIHDNDRISKILGYSVNTIYSYKNRIKTKSLVSNDEFEDRIMEIAAV